MCKCVYYISVYTSAIHEIGIYSAHIVVSFRHFKRFWLFFNYRCGLYWRAAVTAEQICYCFGIRLIVKPTDKVNGIASDSLVLVIPKVTLNRYF